MMKSAILYGDGVSVLIGDNNFRLVANDYGYLTINDQPVHLNNNGKMLKADDDDLAEIKLVENGCELKVGSYIVNFGEHFIEVSRHYNNLLTGMWFIGWLSFQSAGLVGFDSWLVLVLNFILVLFAVVLLYRLFWRTVKLDVKSFVKVVSETEVDNQN